MRLKSITLSAVGEMFLLDFVAASENIYIVYCGDTHYSINFRIIYERFGVRRSCTYNATSAIVITHIYTREMHDCEPNNQPSVCVVRIAYIYYSNTARRDEGWYVSWPKYLNYWLMKVRGMKGKSLHSERNARKLLNLRIGDVGFIWLNIITLTQYPWKQYTIRWCKIDYLPIQNRVRCVN